MATTQEAAAAAAAAAAASSSHMMKTTKRGRPFLKVRVSLDLLRVIVGLCRGPGYS